MPSDADIPTVSIARVSEALLAVDTRGFETHDRKVLSLPTRFWDPTQKVWTMPDRPEIRACLLAWFAGALVGLDLTLPESMVMIVSPLDDGQFRIDSPHGWPRAWTDWIQTLPGRSWRDDARAWVVADCPETRQAIRDAVSRLPIRFRGFKCQLESERLPPPLVVEPISPTTNTETGRSASEPSLSTARGGRQPSRCKATRRVRSGIPVHLASRPRLP